MILCIDPSPLSRLHHPCVACTPCQTYHIFLSITLITRVIYAKHTVFLPACAGYEYY